MPLTADHLRRIARMALATGAGFVERVRLAELDPAVAFRDGLLRCSMRGQNLGGFDFTGAEFPAAS